MEPAPFRSLVQLHLLPLFSGAQLVPGTSPSPPQRPAVALVTHAGVILTLLKRVRGEPLKSFGGIRIDFGSVHGLEHRDGRWQVISENV